MNFVCDNCTKKKIHDVCRDGWCDCQHRTQKVD